MTPPPARWVARASLCAVLGLVAFTTTAEAQGRRGGGEARHAPRVARPHGAALRQDGEGPVTLTQLCLSAAETPGNTRESGGGLARGPVWRGTETLGAARLFGRYLSRAGVPCSLMFQGGV